MRQTEGALSMSQSTQQLKAALRRRLRQQLKSFSPAERAAVSTQIRERIRQQPVWLQAACVLLYAPLPDEPDVFPLLNQALSAGKSVALLRHLSSDDSFAPRRVRDPQRDLRPGKFGILEPLESCSAIGLEQLDLTLVPGLGFSLAGGRLGRGLGHYDRLLAKVQGWKCGVAFDWQVGVEVPTESHDVVLDFIVTPTRWLEMVARP
jgi:5-formyltetrahydrofolate cyclo-ligase